MVGRLAGKVALITGSSSGLGRAIAIAYAAQGARICLADLYSSPRQPLANHHSRTTKDSTLSTLTSLHGDNAATFVKTDVTSPSSVEGAVAHCVDSFERLDILVNNAGISVESTHDGVKRVHETSEEDYDATMAVNAKGVFLGCKYGIAQMLRQEVVHGCDRGWVVNTASVQGMVGYYGTSSYCAAKGAVVQLTRQVALDYGRDRVHVNALCPGFLKTDMTGNIQRDPELLAKTNEAHPFGGMGKVEDVARAAVFLASEDAAWVTGVPLPVDGGYLTL